VKPAPFKYLAARSFDDALAFKAQHGADARFLAGGQSLVPVLNFRLTQPAVLIDINDVAGASGVTLADNELRIGALTRYRTLQREALIVRHCPLIAEALPHIAHPQIRNRGTIGGNLCHADPASELPAIMLALGARLRLRSAGGERLLDARDFFTGALSTALHDDEMLAELIVPLAPPRTGTSFMEVARRRGDFAMMGVAAVVRLGEDGTCRDARLAFCGAGDRPVLAAKAAAGLIGGKIEHTDIETAARSAMQEVEPHGSVHASADYQRHLAGVLTRRALKMARGRAR
jgi:carbon-monoxide dehydrogenase medium subunit